MGIPLVCERWVTLPANPDLVDIDRLYQNISKGKRLDASSLGTASLSGTGGIVLRRTRSLERLSGSLDQVWPLTQFYSWVLLILILDCEKPNE